jgi:hypothetical protein
MSDPSEPQEPRAAERGELILPDTAGAAEPHHPQPARRESVEEPAKVMRIGSMIKQLLDEVRTTTLDEASRDRLRDIYDLSISELGDALSDDLRDELHRLAMPFDGEAAPSDAEIRVAKAQLVGWLEGLFHGIQATLFAQQVAARQQLEQMRSELPPGEPHGPPPDRPGTYL